MSLRSTKKAARTADPVVRALREEQLRQQISDYALSKELMGVPNSQAISRLWAGDNVPKLDTIRKVLKVLQRANPEFHVVIK